VAPERSYEAVFLESVARRQNNSLHSIRHGEGWCGLALAKFSHTLACTQHGSDRLGAPPPVALGLGFLPSHPTKTFQPTHDCNPHTIATHTPASAGAGFLSTIHPLGRTFSRLSWWCKIEL